ncbi:hypothetical protein [Qipengyuania sp. MTN3-11]|uniref:hypothetical protein n=1 Tax=Qipengyuania sp. MTN3-11 TaxID=3056557 RepID=UPI0036F21318
MPRPHLPAGAAFLALSLAGCQSTQGVYPSLAVRDIERVEGQFETAPAPPLDVPNVPTEYTGTLAQRLAALGSAAREAHARFLSARQGAAQLAAAASGAEIGSDSWASAQVALADLDSIRSDTAIALADLDILAIAAEVQAEDKAGIEAARAEVLTLVSEEDRTLAELRARLR